MFSELVPLSNVEISPLPTAGDFTSLQVELNHRKTTTSGLKMTFKQTQTQSDVLNRDRCSSVKEEILVPTLQDWWDKANIPFKKPVYFSFEISFAYFAILIL